MTGKHAGAPHGNPSPDAPEEMVARFRGPLLSFFQRRVGDSAEAEDLTQEVFLRLVRRKDILGIENVQTYVFQIAANLLRDRFRRSETHCQREHFSLDAESATPFLPGLVEDRGPERVLLGEEAVSEVLRALDELGERTRDIFILHRVEKMKHRDIAKLHGIAVSTVEKIIMRAGDHLIMRFGQKRPPGSPK